MSDRAVNPIDKLSYADQALQELRERRETEAQRAKNAAALSRRKPGKPGDNPAEPKPVVTVRWTWPMPVATGCAVLLVVLVAILK
jgi:uncharacterized protein (DUF4415 family)